MSDRPYTLEQRERVERALLDGELYGEDGLVARYRIVADAARRYLALTADDARLPRTKATATEIREATGADGETAEGRAGEGK